MFKKTDKQENWRGGVYLITTSDAMEADILESKLRGEGIACIRKYEGAGNYMEILFGAAAASNAIDLYVAEDKLADAENIIVPVDLDDCEEIEE